MSNPIKLTGLSPREAAIDAVYRAALAIDTNDRELWNSVFSAPGTASFEPVFELAGHTFTGVEQITTSLFDRIGPMDTQHLLGNSRVVFNSNGTEAQVTSQGFSQHFRPGEGKNPESKGFLAGNTYIVDVVKDEQDETWKVKKWVGNMIWTEGDSSVMGGGPPPAQ